MKISIIGCGWLGLPLAIKLLDEGHQVFGSATSDEKVTILNSKGIQGFKFLNGNEIPHKVKFQTDLLIITIPPKKNDDYLRIIENVIQNFPKGIKAIYTSSIGVYLNENAIVNENSPVDFNHVVFEAENKIKSYFEKYSILRLAGLIGEDRNPVFSLSGKKIKNSNSGINLVNRNDIISCIESLIKSDKFPSIYNVCNPDHSSKRDYYSRMAEINSVEPPIFELELEPYKIVDGGLIERELKFKYSGLYRE